jgi:hypothetical protein
LDHESTSTRSRNRSSGLLHSLWVSFFLLAVASYSTQPADALGQRSAPATFIAYVTAPASGSIAYALSCTARAGARIQDFVLAHAAATQDDLSDVDVYFHAGWTDGDMLQVADRDIVWQNRTKDRSGSTSGFTDYSSVNGPTSGYTAEFAVALWGADADCSVTIKGKTFVAQSAADARALFVPPNEFSTGPYYVSGDTTIEIGRTYEMETPGGTVFAAMSTGGTDRALGTFVAQTSKGLVVDVCERGHYYYCDGLAASGAEKVSLSMTSLDLSGAEPGELFIIALPRSAF